MDAAEADGGGERPPADLGIVVIGRNEGARLAESLASALGFGPLVYVDSGSTDGSVATARALGAEVVELSAESLFTAGRARNAGLERLRAVAPSLPYVMFLDGDCTLDPAWPGRAVRELDGAPDVVAVCGRRRERATGRSVLRRLLDLEWDTPLGDSTTCGGDAAFRVGPFAAVGGFDPGLVVGEEPELCQRLRDRGGRIVRIDAEMCVHDMGEATLRAWWIRNVRQGYWAWELVRRSPAAARPYRRHLASSWLWGAAVPSAIALTVATGPPRLGGRAWLLLLAASIYPAQAVRLAWAVRRRVDGPGTALAFGIATIAAKWAHLAGQFAHLADRVAGRAGRPLEYRPSRR